jgi:bifunctional non-homologous end joining protein LigD
VVREYKAKRHFERTPEPKGKPGHGTGALRFVVQKHDASRLHYDFRLELDGVLKSWAVPKGPSLDPADRRLAIHVEDHPLEYRNFEGIIPEGNYGAGTVMVWDEGTYEPADVAGTRAEQEARLRDGLAKGRLSFVLHGRKLRGRFALVKTKGPRDNEWLLIKHGDEHAVEADVRTKDRSVRSRRTLDGIARQAARKGEVWPSNRSAKKKATVKRARRPPVKPMLATLVDAPFDRAGWLFEIKWDGYRAIAEIEGGAVRLYSRNDISFKDKFAAIANALAGLGRDAILDGEVVVLDDTGQSSFQLLQNYQKTGRGNLVYCVFDLLELDGKNVRALPLKRRKELLRELVAGVPHVQFSEHVERDGVGLFDAAAAQGLEGIIAKRADSPYQEGRRGPDWLKIKVRRRQEAVIGGFTRPRGSRKRLGALVLGVYDGDELVYVGHTGTGFSDKGLDDIYAKLAPLVRASCPFKKRPATNMPARWVEPTLVCEVAFQEWTEERLMRHPVFLGLREDKPARDVRREVPASRPTARATKPAARKAAPREPDVELTNLDKVYWPADGYTKGDLIDYYRQVAPIILPHLRDRPMSLHRHPNGIDVSSFFQKDVTSQPPPPWVKTVPVVAESDGTTKTQIVCQDTATLLYVANLGCIEMNPWNSRVGTLDRPDYLVIDLDPNDAPFALAVEAAQHVRRLLDKHCAPCFCKTSGKRGLHVYVPLEARYDFDLARQFAELIANLVHRRMRATSSVVRNPRLREGQLYLDYLQNRRAQTMAAPYSVRPVPGATVSTPLKWSEVTKRLDPTRFTIRTLPRRLDKLGDLWGGVLGPGADLARCVHALEPGA